MWLSWIHCTGTSRDHANPQFSVRYKIIPPKWVSDLKCGMENPREESLFVLGRHIQETMPCLRGELPLWQEMASFQAEFTLLPADGDPTVSVIYVYQHRPTLGSFHLFGVSQNAAGCRSNNPPNPASHLPMMVPQDPSIMNHLVHLLGLLCLALADASKINFAETN